MEFSHRLLKKHIPPSERPYLSPPADNLPPHYARRINGKSKHAPFFPFQYLKRERKKYELRIDQICSFFKKHDPIAVSVKGNPEIVFSPPEFLFYPFLRLGKERIRRVLFKRTVDAEKKRGIFDIWKTSKNLRKEERRTPASGVDRDPNTPLDC